MNLITTYANRSGEWLNIWRLDQHGQFVSPDNALRVDVLTDEQRAQIDAHNADLQALADAVAALEAARRVNQPDESVPATVLVEDEETPHPLWRAWNDAQALIEAAADSDEAIVLDVRRGRPEPVTGDDGQITNQIYLDQYDAKVDLLLEAYGQTPVIELDAVRVALVGYFDEIHAFVAQLPPGAQSVAGALVDQVRDALREAADGEGSESERLSAMAQIAQAGREQAKTAMSAWR